jgi:NAD(P)-dependent dehydrogenase (short-subunit alcohol dehydrogenase family)
MGRLQHLIDGVLDATIAPGYSRLGYEIRSRSDEWESLAPNCMEGRVVVITGATSGLGLATARRLRSLGAALVLVGRDRDRTEKVARELVDGHRSNARVDVVVADMAEPSQVRDACLELASLSRIDVLVHNAGSLSKQRIVNSAGLESTLAAQVVGPFIMTDALLDVVERSHGRVITVSSGGMYAATLADMSASSPEPLAVNGYDGTKQYATAKRMQVTLNEMWAQRRPDVHFASMHPGWADTPGVRTSLPGFARWTGPFLRDAEQGADTIVWLSATDTSNLGTSGGFWSDRARRPIHRLGSTRRSDRSDRRRALWEWCAREATTAH